MSRDEGAGAGSILLAFILGAVSGAAVALLYAPASGPETREDPGGKADEARAKAPQAAARRVGRLADSFERDVRPLLGHLNAIGRDAARAAQLATAQVERADRLFADAAQRFEQTLAGIEASIAKPAREGRALLSAFRAAFQALREMRRDGRRQGRGDDE